MNVQEEKQCIKYFENISCMCLDDSVNISYYLWTIQTLKYSFPLFSHSFSGSILMLIKEYEKMKRLNKPTL